MHPCFHTVIFGRNVACHIFICHKIMSSAWFLHKIWLKSDLLWEHGMESLITFFMKIVHGWKFYQGTFCLSVSELRDGIHRWQVSVLCCHITFNPNLIFCETSESVKVLSGDIFISVFVNKLHDGIHSHEYLYHLATSYSSLITFCAKTVHWSRFDWGGLSEWLEPFGGVCRCKYS
jgi:hypothetical protein